ncbi:MAG: DUF5680 domain-containing protein [Eubacteriales bacterium]
MATISKEISRKELIVFLLRAKGSTYAGRGPESESLRPNSHDLHYAEGSLKYIDSYLGGKSFAGQEAVWYQDTPIWAMNYVGRVISNDFSNDFLRQCLSLVTKEDPYRGPLYYSNGDYVYRCIVNGDFEWYHGREEILFKGEMTYECLFHGGLIE